MTVRESWTDERLDDLNHRVGELGRRMDEGFNAMRAEFNALHRTMVQYGGAMVIALIGLIATQL
jgi:hypothetical protein